MRPDCGAETKPYSVGRADSLRPASVVASSTIGMILAMTVGAGVFIRVDLIALLQSVTMVVAWISVLLGLARLLACLTSRRRPGPELRNEFLPSYTVIVPLFREDNMVAGLIESLSALDYPQDKLDIIFVCESDDPDTIECARRSVRRPFRLLIVPPPRPAGEPRTKPRALNYALARSDGELVTIYDAEDRPHPQQLRRAAEALSRHPRWSALQAPLHYFNTRDSLLASQFGLEYASLFEVLLPFYDRFALPFPLGGTSNHMRRSALDAVGGWDAYNVTEDADLAFRLAAQGGQIGWISPPTQEEAVAQFRPWCRQRSRWLKGYIQTWLVHMNSPFAGGWRRALMLQATLGHALLSVLFFAPVMFSLTCFALAQWVGITDAQTPRLYLLALGFSLICGMMVGAVGALRAGQKHLLRHVPLMPLYWLILFPPLMQALIEMRTRPFHWHKTQHGVTGAPPGDPG